MSHMSHLFLARVSKLSLSLAVAWLASTGLPACAEAEEVRATGLPDSAGVAPGDTEPLAMPKTVAVGQDRFFTSTACALCHSNNTAATAMRDELDRPIAPFNLWQGTMMANASRDPFWRAVVTAEAAQTPSQKAAIEAKCMRCHAPMASEAAHVDAAEPSLRDLKNELSLTQLAGDGVSCSVCHQIQPANLGTEESFNGGFVIGSERRIFGPHRNPATGPMQAHVNYTPTFADHVTQSKLCATCHTLGTTPLLADGSVVEGGHFQEQATYLEWQNSRFNNEDGADGQTCQGCHMPLTSEDGVVVNTRIARSPPGGDFNINPREPFGRHAFTGANTFMPGILKAERATLNPQATDDAFDATIALAKHRLEVLTASVDVKDVSVADDTAAFKVTVLSEVGHKLPTGFPSRRAWLQVIVRDKNGAVIFSSGTTNGEGRIVDDLGDVLDIEKTGGPTEPHHDVVRRSDEVQIYESVMQDGDGARTGSVLRAVSHAKDNRILPGGYSPEHDTHARIAAIGVADDDSFVAGQDTVSYRVPLRGKQPATVEVAFVYQSVSARFARDLFQVDTPEVRAFRTMYERANRQPATIATATASVP